MGINGFCINTRNPMGINGFCIYTRNPMGIKEFCRAPPKMYTYPAAFLAIHFKSSRKSNFLHRPHRAKLF